MALDAVPSRWRTLGYAVRFEPYTRSTGLGVTNSRTRTITVYVKERQATNELRATIGHELGHALDFGFATVEKRAEYRRIRGLATDTPWYPCDGCDDLSSPAGDWAEVFAAFLTGTSDFRSRLAGPPTRAQLDSLAPVFREPGSDGA